MPWFFSMYSQNFFKLFSTVHLLTLAVVFLIISLLLLTLTYCSSRINRVFQISFSIFVLCIELAYQFWLFSNDSFHYKTSLPFTICSFSLLLSSIVMITKNKLAIGLLFVWGLIGSIYALLFPNIMFNFPHFRYFEFFIAHASILFVVLYMLIVEKVIIVLKDIFIAYGLTSLYFIFILLINKIFGSNYLYLSKKPSFQSFFDILGDWPWYIFQLLLCLLPLFCFVFVLYVFIKKIFFINKLRPKVKIINILLIMYSLLFMSCEINNSINEKPSVNKNWTFMFYLGGDNNLESYLLRNIEQIKRGFQGGMNVVICIDRSERYSLNQTALGENFTGLRVYSLENKKYVLQTTENVFMNMHENNEKISSTNIKALGSFIDFCKKKYPAENYALFIGSHGDGARARALKNRGIVQSEKSNDWIYTNQFSELLNIQHSVDVLGVDACFMGNIEFIYQIRKNNFSFSSDFVVASSPTEWAYGWDYEMIFKRIHNKTKNTFSNKKSFTTGKKKVVFSSANLTPLELGKILVDEHYDYTYQKTNDQALALYNTAHVEELKECFDKLFVLLKNHNRELDAIRGDFGMSQKDALFYFDSFCEYEWIDYSYYDLYDLCTRINDMFIYDKKIREFTKKTQESLTKVLLYSFGGEYFSRFNNNITGLSVFFPSGNREYLE